MDSSSLNRQRGNELLSALAATVDAEAAIGIPGLGERVAARIALEWGGQQLYLPMDRTRRNRMIYAAFTGDNYHDLARKYRMSERAVREVVRKERDRRRAKHLRLPGVVGED